MSVPEVVYVSFSAEINQMTTESLLGVCANMANSRVPKVYLLLSTPGGLVMNGITLYNSLRAMPFKLVVHNVGSVNSIGNVIFLAGSERYSCAHATFMFHGVGFDVTSPMRFEQKGLEERLDSVVADQKKIGAIITERTKISPDSVDELFRQAMTRDPEYAKANGIIHDIRDVQIPPGAPLTQLVFQR